MSYDPAFAYEIAVIIQDGIRRMYDEQDERLLLHHGHERELPPCRRCPRARAEGILRGMYPLVAAEPSEGRPRVQLLGSGTILREVLAAADLLRDDFGVAADVWSVTSFTELRRDAMEVERWNLLHPDEEPRARLGRKAPGGRRRARRRGDRLHARVRRPDPAVGAAPYRVLGTDGFGRSDYRRRCAASSRWTAITSRWRR